MDAAGKLINDKAN